MRRSLLHVFPLSLALGAYALAAPAMVKETAPAPPRNQPRRAFYNSYHPYGDSSLGGSSANTITDVGGGLDLDLDLDGLDVAGPGVEANSCGGPAANQYGHGAAATTHHQDSANSGVVIHADAGEATPAHGEAHTSAVGPTSFHVDAGLAAGLGAAGHQQTSAGGTGVHADALTGVVSGLGSAGYQHTSAGGDTGFHAGAGLIAEVSGLGSAGHQHTGAAGYQHTSAGGDTGFHAGAGLIAEVSGLGSAGYQHTSAGGDTGFHTGAGLVAEVSGLGSAGFQHTGAADYQHTSAGGDTGFHAGAGLVAEVLDQEGASARGMANEVKVRSNP